MTNKEAKALAKVEGKVAAARSVWLSGYNAENESKGTVILGANPALQILWNELVAVRTERNRLLAQCRASGMNI